MKKGFFISLLFNITMVVFTVCGIFYIYSNYSYTGQNNFVYDNTINSSNYYQQYVFRRGNDSSGMTLFIDENYACKVGNIAIKTAFKNYNFKNKTNIFLCEDSNENGNIERYYIITKEVDSNNNSSVSVAISKDNGRILRVWLNVSE